jgi:hypothetical protein
MKEYLPLLFSIAFTLISLGIAYVKFIRGNDKDQAGLATRVAVLESQSPTTLIERLAKLEGKMVLCEAHTVSLSCLPQIQQDIAAMKEQNKIYWEVIAPRLRDIIHSPIHKTRDALVDLLIEDKIKTVEQAATLQDELEKLWAETQNPAEQVASAIFLARTKWLLAELKKKAAQEG